jgi:excisionase family DNA binding protein
MATAANQSQQTSPVLPFEPFIAKPEVARRLNKKLRTVDKWMQQGLIPYYKIGRSVSFKWSEVEKHLRELCRVCHGEDI